MVLPALPDLPAPCFAISNLLHTAHPQVSSGDCPHLLFYGPPGTGKKTLIIGLLRELYGPPVEKVLPFLHGHEHLIAVHWPVSTSVLHICTSLTLDGPVPVHAWLYHTCMLTGSCCRTGWLTQQ